MLDVVVSTSMFKRSGQWIPPSVPFVAARRVLDKISDGGMQLTATQSFDLDNAFILRG